jgi:uncharacterized membrane protein
MYRALSNYSYPNNHLLHTFLAYLTIHVFGDTGFALRLPAFLAESLTVPMSWLTGRILYGRVAATLTAGCLASLPTFIEFSVNARGYSLQWLFILAMMCCAGVLHVNPSMRVAGVRSCRRGWLVRDPDDGDPDQRNYDLDDSVGNGRWRSLPPVRFS